MLTRSLGSSKPAGQRQRAAAGSPLPPRQRSVIVDVGARRQDSRSADSAAPAGARAHARSPPPSCLRLPLAPTFPPRAGALCLPALLEARSSTLRWVSGGPLPPHGAQRCVAAALPLERSPSRRRPVTARTFLRPSHPCCACTTARSLPPSTSPALGHALGWALPRLRRRGRAPGGNAARFHSACVPLHTEWSTSNGGASARAGGPGTR